MTSVVRADLGDKAVIGCYATGTPPIKYTWSKNGASINNLTICVFGNIIVAQPQGAMDYGIYHCNASNLHQAISYPIKLVPLSTCKMSNSSRYDKLKILTNKMTSLVRADLGDRVILGCYATGAPTIAYNWTKDGIPLDSSSTVKVIENVVVVHPRTEKDFGTFVCRVFHGKQIVSYPIRLQQIAIAASNPIASTMNNVYKTAFVPYTIVLGILLIVLLLVIIYLIRRHQRTKKRLQSEPGMAMSDIRRMCEHQASQRRSDTNDYETLVDQSSSPDSRNDTGYYASPVFNLSKEVMDVGNIDSADNTLNYIKA